MASERPLAFVSAASYRSCDCLRVSCDRRGSQPGHQYGFILGAGRGAGDYPDRPAHLSFYGAFSSWRRLRGPGRRGAADGRLAGLGPWPPAAF